MMQNTHDIIRTIAESAKCVEEWFARMKLPNTANSYNNGSLPIAEIISLHADRHWCLYEVLDAAKSLQSDKCGLIDVEVNGQTYTVQWKLVCYVIFPDGSHISDKDDAGKFIMSNDRHYRARFVRFDDLNTAMLFKLTHGGEA